MLQSIKLELPSRYAAATVAANYEGRLPKVKLSPSSIRITIRGWLFGPDVVFGYIESRLGVAHQFGPRLNARRRFIHARRGAVSLSLTGPSTSRQEGQKGWGGCHRSVGSQDKGPCYLPTCTRPTRLGGWRSSDGAP
jgi:hypothetical protein